MGQLSTFVAIAILLTFANKAYCRSVLVNDEGEADGDYEETEDKALKNQVGVLDIIGGAFEGNLNKILKGSFSFSDKQIGEALIPQIVGADKMPEKKKPAGASPTRTKGNEEDDAES